MLQIRTTFMQTWIRLFTTMRIQILCLPSCMTRDKVLLDKETPFFIYLSTVHNIYNYLHIFTYLGYRYLVLLMLIKVQIRQNNEDSDHQN
jgi:hypothetical protein